VLAAFVVIVSSVQCGDALDRRIERKSRVMQPSLTITGCQLQQHYSRHAARAPAETKPRVVRAAFARGTRHCLVRCCAEYVFFSFFFVRRIIDVLSSASCHLATCRHSIFSNCTDTIRVVSLIISYMIQYAIVFV